MNSNYTEILLILVFVLLLLILVLVAIIGVVVLKQLWKKNGQTSEGNKPQTEVVQSLKELMTEKVVESFFCPNHPEIETVSTCLICEEAYCEKCMIEHENMHFCKEHFRVFATNKWRQITDLKTSAENPETGLYIYHYKRQIWKEKQIPSFIQTHYKINIDEDYIESFIQLNVREEEADEIIKELEKEKAKH